MPEKRLRIYLNDHSAGSLAGLELAKRCFANNASTELGAYLRRLIEELEAERAELLRLIDALGFPRAKVKEGLGWFAEKAGRLKLNGQVRGYSELGRIYEIEGLMVAATAKLRLWHSLRRVSRGDRRIAIVDFESLIAQAEGQVHELSQHHRAAVQKAFGD